MDRTADLNWPKTPSILWNVLLSIYMEESWLRATDRCTGMGCALVSGWWVTALCITCFPLSLFKLFFTIIITIIIFYVISIITVFSTCEFYLFPVPLLIPLWGKEGACGFVVLTEWLGLKQQYCRHGSREAQDKELRRQQCEMRVNKVNSSFGWVEWQWQEHGFGFLFRRCKNMWCKGLELVR